MKKQQVFNIKGMTKDISRSKSGSELAYDIQNMRLTSQEGETLLSLTNEKGNKEYKLDFKKFATNSDGTVDVNESRITFTGKVIGYCVLDKYLVIFTHQEGNKNKNIPSQNRIYRFEEDSTDKMTLDGCLLYWDYGDYLDFTDTMRLETMGIYESTNIQKVYWLDGVHQPRFINIAGDKNTVLNHRKRWKAAKTPFDFIPMFDYDATIEGNNNITIKRQDYGGMFPEGTIQYAMCYYNLNGQQSNIFYVSPIYYISHTDRGAQQEQTLNNSFKITIKKVDTNFDYLRIYSIHRSSINGTPSCKVVANISLK